MSVEARLAALGLVLPPASAPAASYTNVVQVGSLLFVAGKAPGKINGAAPSGKLGGEFNIEEGYNFARQTGLEILAVVKAYCDSLENVKRVVEIQGFVNATADFTEHHKVLNGCSELMTAVFGDRGIHACSVTGAVSLRDNLPIVIDSIFEALV